MSDWPRCVECGKVIKGNRIDAAKVYDKKTRDREKDRKLRGVYCDTDCLLDAVHRGWALCLRF
jgi:ribosomal protein L34E